MIYKVLVNSSFYASHYVRLPNGEWEEPHSHNYKVEVCISSEELDENGMVIDFTLVDSYLEKIKEKLNNTILNENPLFDEVIPTAENIAKVIFTHISESIKKEKLANSPKVEYVKVSETDRYSSVVQSD
jgi:6-pyruvoyltetrahydropterin/6-carboxytetrahydropterin synthase